MMQLKKLLDFVMGRGKKDITRRVLRFFLLVGVITLILSSVLALGGIFTTEDNLREMGQQLGSSTRENVTELVVEREKDNLEKLVHEKVGTMDELFKSIAKDTKTLSENAADILSAPQDYLPKELIRAKSMDDGWTLALALAPSVANDNDFENLRGQIALAANNQNSLKNVALSYDIGCSTYNAFEVGFDIVVDTEESDRRNYFENTKSSTKPYREFNFKERAWYKNAKEQNRVVFSDTLLNATKHSNDDPIIVCSAPITLNGEFVGVSGMGFFVKDITKATLKTAIGESGFWVLMNKYGQVIVSPKTEGDFAVTDDFPDLRKSPVQSLAAAADKMSRGSKDLMLVKVDGEDYFLAFEPLQSVEWSFGALIKVSEVTAPADAVAMSIDIQTDDFISRTENFSLKLLPIMAAAFVILLAAISILSKHVTKSIVTPIHQLADGVREISGGNLDKKLEIKTGDEIEHLATCFNAMTDELKNYMANLEKETAERERISTELNVATNIQLSALPHDFDFGRKDFEIYATMHAAKEVGGDFYDFYLVDEKHLVVTMADVSGKGVPAALFMMKGKTILKNLTMMMNTLDDLASVMGLANQQLCQGNDEMMFITIFHAMLDLETGRLIYVNGGHNPPVLYHDGKFEYMSVEQNCVVGIMDDMDFEQQEIQLAPGDILYMYTDGVTEAMDEENNQYGEDRLQTCLNEKDCSRELPELLEHVKKDLGEHVGKAPQSDDITMLALKWRGTL